MMWSCVKCNIAFKTRTELIVHRGNNCPKIVLNFQAKICTFPQDDELKSQGSISGINQDNLDDKNDDSSSDDNLPLTVYLKKKNKPPTELSDDYTVATGETNSTEFITNSTTFTKECGIDCSPLLLKSNQMQSNENNISDFSEEYDNDVDPLYDPQTDGLPLKKLKLQNLKRLNRSISKDDSNSDQNESVIVEDLSVQMESSKEDGPPASTGIEKKRKKGVRKREEELKKKEQGLAYVTRKGKAVPAKSFTPLEKCCKKKCYLECTLDQQKELFLNYFSRSKLARHEILCERIKVSKKAIETKKKGKRGKTKNRQITATYSINVGSTKKVVCKTMFCHMHGISRAQVEHLVNKIKNSPNGNVAMDKRGKHSPKNKLSNERNKIRLFIEKYPRHISHYSRRECSEKIYLPSHLTITKMYEEYKKLLEENGERLTSYDVFRDVFNSTGFKFKQPYLDTCKKCDEFKLKKKCSATQNERDSIAIMHDEHILEAEKGYESKKQDKESAKHNASERVLVFDLQQVLSTPHLSTNIAYYKRTLSTYNLTVRDCQLDEDTQCFMWHEAVAGRGSDQIASCVFKKLMSLPESVTQVTTYSDTCGGQNRNINMAIMFSYAMLRKSTLEVINQKFLLPGHTRLECDSDHARIERAKKQIGPDMAIMTPRDWYSFVRMVSGKKRKFEVTAMVREDFFAFSKLLAKDSVFIKKLVDTDGKKIEWLKIKWLQYKQTFGVINFKYTLEESEPFRTFDLRRQKKGRPLALHSIDIPLSYKQMVPINPLKKQDLLSLLSLIDKDCHEFYRSLQTTEDAAEFDELEDFTGET